MAQDVSYSVGNSTSHAMLTRMKQRLSLLVLFFALLFAIITARLFYISLVKSIPQDPRLLLSQHAGTVSDASLKDDQNYDAFGTKRATVIDRNGQTLAVSLPVVQVYANPQEITDPRFVTRKLSTVLPQINRKALASKLADKHRQFVYIERNVTQTQEVAINNLGIPGIYFLPSEQRFYPLGTTASHILGAVNVDGEGIAGIEKSFNTRLRRNHEPLRLSIDTRIQSLVHDILVQAAQEYQTNKACAIVLDVHTGEVIALVSLPDFEADNFSHSSDEARFNRAVTGLYEPGSTFKLQTIAMGLATRAIHIWDNFSSQPIHIDHFRIQDMASDHFPPWLSVPQTMAFSSNPASAHIALDVGEEREKKWLDDLGFFAASPIELPETSRPLLPRRWGITTTMTIGFGHGLALSPITIASGFSPTVNGGIWIAPTLLAQPSQTAPIPSHRVMPAATSSLLRKLLRLDVTTGTGKSAEVKGYYVGGKTGTAEKIGNNGHYLKHNNIASFTGIFPMNNPRYSVYVMFDEPQPTAQTHGWTTAGWNAAPTTASIVSHIGPLLNILPDIDNKKKIDASLVIPMHPAAPAGVKVMGPGYDPGEENLQRYKRLHHHGVKDTKNKF